MNYRVFIADNLAPKAKELLENKGFDVLYKPGLDEDGLVENIPGCHAVLVRSGVRITKKVLDAADQLKVIGRAGTGVDNIDVAYATTKGVQVLNVPGGNSVTAAEHTIGLIFAMMRNIPQADASMRGGAWNRKAFAGHELTGKTLGVAGFGRVGNLVADRALGLRMRVLGFDPVLPDFMIEAGGAIPVEFDELLAKSDILTLHMPLNDTTRGLINADTLAKMKKGSYIINVARGPIIDTAALYDAIKSGHIAGAAIDVYDQEPPKDNPLVDLPNVVTTPHLGASTKEAQERVSVSIAVQAGDFLTKGIIFGAVNHL